ncbi:unnamed protein product [Bursaphelenchus okinawaensis]|uniref:Uncharacterized protein n=1 Tax=Bursaphelenchus okinawaensis TaxID=465554 RepID=A0A811JTD9_9BILA|nr:unnamed protein product [Bursaphelenchus okinawaensis]CAG9082201.1 unnamed protein product [Bursaphelenchus okinawaensis]
MRSLGFRYSDKVLKGDCFIVDPYVDFRSLFRDKSLKESLLKRGKQVGLDLVEKNYASWWSCYQTYLNDSSPTNKQVLKSSWPSLQAVLKLPPVIQECHIGEIKQCDVANKHQVSAEFVLDDVALECMNNIKNAIRVSTPSIVRSAVLEGCNVEVDRHLGIADSDPQNYVVGTSLPSTLSLLVRKELTNSKVFPCTLISAGKGYSANNGQILEQKLVSLLRLSSSNGFTELLNDVVSIIARINPNVTITPVQPNDLTNYEAAACTIAIDRVDVAKVSSVGDYISRRLHVVKSGRFVNMTHALIYCDLLKKFVD